MTEKYAARTGPKVLPYAWVILFAAYLASVMAPLNQFKVPPIMPVLLSTFHIDLTQAGLLMSSIALVGLILSLPAGIILQRLGHKLSGLIAVGFIALGAAVGALSGSFNMLLLSRVIEGVGVGLISVVAPATISRWFPPEKQGTPMGLWATWVPVGTVVMYNAAPGLTAAYGWHAVWWFGTIVALVTMVIFAALMRKPPYDAQSDAAHAAPLDLRKALANRDIWLLSLAFMCFNLALVSFGTYYPTFLNQVRGYDLGRAAFIASLGTGLVLFTAPLAGLLSDRIGSRRLLISFPFLVIGAALFFPFQVTGWLIIAIQVVLSFMSGAIPTATFAAAPEIMRRPEWAGLGLAAVLVGQNLGQLVGPVLFGQFVNNMGWAMAGYLMIPVCLVGFVSAWLIKIR